MIYVKLFFFADEVILIKGRPVGKFVTYKLDMNYKRSIDDLSSSKFFFGNTACKNGR